MLEKKVLVVEVADQLMLEQKEEDTLHYLPIEIE